MLIRMIGSMKDLNYLPNNEQTLSLFALDIRLSKLRANIDFIDIIVDVEGAFPSVKPITSSNNRNGYVSKQLAFNREFTITTRRLYNHKEVDSLLMKKMDYLHTFPHHYFTFWELKFGEYIMHHKSELGRYYFVYPPELDVAMTDHNCIVCTFEAPSIKNNPANSKSEHSAHRIYSWKATEYGIRSVKDITGD